jgi:hypothetical protein
VAQYGDVANFDAGAGEGLMHVDIRQKIDALRRHCDQQERPFDSVVISHFVRPIIIGNTSQRVQEKVNALSGPFPWTGPGVLTGTPDQIIAYYQPLISLGIRYFMGHLSDHADLETLELLAEKVLPELHPH